MSSPNELELELDDLETDFEALLESEETPPEAFYLALRRALSQLDAEPSSGNWL